MTPDITLTQGDVGLLIEATLRDADGNVLDLSDASQVRFLYRPWGSAATEVTARTATVYNVAGIVRYVTVAGDAQTPGDYWAEFEVTKPAQVVSCPTKPKLWFRVVEQMG